MKNIFERTNLYALIVELQEKVKILEEENIETTNALYELQNNIESVDRRIDILFSEKNDA